MEDHIKHAHAFMDEVKKRPEVQVWRKEQAAKIALQQQGTWRERQDAEGKPVPKAPSEGVESWFSYSIADVGIATAIKVRCVLTNDEIDLTPPAEFW